MESLRELVHRRPGALIGALIGLVIAGLIWRGEDTRKGQVEIRNRIIRVEAKTPCLNLTAAECSIKLFRALPEEQRRQLQISERTIRSLERRAIRERQVLRDRSALSDRFGIPRAGGGSPGGSPGDPSPTPGTQPPGSSPVTMTPTPVPMPSPTATPLLRTPNISIPEISPFPPIEIYPILVDCLEIKPFTKC